jgi:hypothetical protein
MPRAGTGHHHGITYERLVKDGMTKIRAACVCGKLNTPFRFAIMDAQEDGLSHMNNIPPKGKPPKREPTSKWVESMQL